MTATLLPTLSLRPLLPFALGFILLFTGCVSNRYKEAREDTAPPGLLDAVLARTPVEAGLITLITYNGPGSWKRDAFWDEYVISLRNPDTKPLTISSFSLVDYTGAVRTPGLNPWALEKESKTLEQKYKDAGLAFVRYTAPGVLIFGAGTAVAFSAGIFSSAAAGAATATVIALPLYYIGVLTINHHNKVAMETEFNRRRLVLPLTLAPGETQTGSLFFPMLPGPRSLNLHWTDGSATDEVVLPLDILSGLHLKAPTAPAPREH